jgi:hypothetical protein
LQQTPAQWRGFICLKVRLADFGISPLISERQLNEYYEAFIFRKFARSSTELFYDQSD